MLTMDETLPVDFIKNSRVVEPSDNLYACRNSLKNYHHWVFSNTEGHAREFC